MVDFVPAPGLSSHTDGSYLGLQAECKHPWQGRLPECRRTYHFHRYKPSPDHSLPQQWLRKQVAIQQLSEDPRTGRSKRLPTMHCGSCDNCGIAVVNSAMSSAMMQSRKSAGVVEGERIRALTIDYVGASSWKVWLLGRARFHEIMSLKKV